MATFPRGHHAFLTRTRNAKTIAAAKPPDIGELVGQHTAADKRTLRGIPVVGGVSGTSPGTDPLAELLRNDRPTR